MSSPSFLITLPSLQGSPGIQLANQGFLDGGRPRGALIAGIRDVGAISDWNRDAGVHEKILIGDSLVAVDGVNLENTPTEEIKELLKRKVASGVLFSLTIRHSRTPVEGKVDEGEEDEREDAAYRIQLDDNIIVANNIHKTYLLGVEGVPALRGVTMTIKRGEFAMLLGKSGGGKTSLLNVLGTIDRPTKGEVTICGKRITGNTTDSEFADLRLRKIGFVFQTFNLISSMTALENVALPMILAGRLTSSEIRERAVALLTRVGMGKRLDHLPSQLSGGEQQRVTISRSLANKPEILLLDEPTGDLDTVNGHIVMNLLLELNRREGITLVMVTHDQDLRKYAHRVFHMVDGKLFRVEEIQEKVRREADRALQRQVQAYTEDSLSLPHHSEQVLESEVRDPVQAYRFNHLHTVLEPAGGDVGEEVALADSHPQQQQSAEVGFADAAAAVPAAVVPSITTDSLHSDS